jgi:FkbM family methyltransferase
MQHTALSKAGNSSRAAMGPGAIGAILRTLRWISHHPLGKDAPGAAVARLVRHQLSTRIAHQPMVVPWINGTRLLVGRGDTGLSGNVYCGLQEFTDMAFVLHFLRPTDLFVDVGANAGSYTIIASGGVGSRTLAVEAVPTTFEKLLDNVHINRLESRVECVNVACGEAPGEIDFSTAQDTAQNHVVAAGETAQSSIRVRVVPLDEMVPANLPVLLKVDVEGFETQVVQGAGRILSDGTVQAMIMELNGSGLRYGHDDAATHRRMLDFGFSAAGYDPFARQLTVMDGRNPGANTLYVRDLPMARERVAAAPKFVVYGREI